MMLPTLPTLLLFLLTPLITATPTRAPPNPESQITLVPAFKVVTTLEAPRIIGPQSNGPILLYSNAKFATLSSFAAYPFKLSAQLEATGGDWMQADPDNLHSKIDVRMLMKTSDGEFLVLSYGGIYTAPDLLPQTVSNGETNFGGIVMVPRFLTGGKWRELQNKVWVGAARSVGEQKVEVVISEVVAVA